jgi:hypothetical protein
LNGIFRYGLVLRGAQAGDHRESMGAKFIAGMRQPHPIPLLATAFWRILTIGRIKVNTYTCQYNLEFL